MWSCGCQALGGQLVSHASAHVTAAAAAAAAAAADAAVWAAASSIQGQGQGCLYLYIPSTSASPACRGEDPDELLDEVICLILCLASVPWKTHRLVNKVQCVYSEPSKTLKAVPTSAP